MTAPVVAAQVGPKISRWAVWRWRQLPAFVEAMNRITDIQVQSRVPLIDHSIQQRALDGSPKHIEAYLRMTGRWNDSGGYAPQPMGRPSSETNGVQVGSVTFVNVPIPPTPQQAEAIRPPPGSNVIIPAPPLPPMPVRAARKDSSRE